MKKIIHALVPALVLMIISTAGARAQGSWTNRYNGPGNTLDVGRAITVDATGNVFVAGPSYSGGGPSSADFLIIKYSNDGLPLWTNRFDGPNGSDQANDIAVDSNGNVIVTGYSVGIGSSVDFLTLKYSNSGLPLWTNRYNGPDSNQDAAYSLAVDSDDSVFVTGASIGNFSDFATIKYSSSGIPLWTNRYNGAGNYIDEAIDISVDGAGNAFVTGFSYGGSSIDWVTIKYSAAGLSQWTNRFDGAANITDEPSAIVTDADGNVFVTGYAVFGPGSLQDFLTIKYSNSGIPQWTNRYNGPGNNVDTAKAIALDQVGNVIVTGGSTGTGTINDYATIKYSTAGVPIWTNRFNGLGNFIDEANAIATDSDNNVFVTGRSTRSITSGPVGTPRYSYVTIKYSTAGSPLWTNSYDGEIDNDNEASAIAIDHDGNAFVTGGSRGSSNTSDWDFLTIKYAAPRAVLESPLLGSNDFSFRLTAQPGERFSVQVSTNFINWEFIQEVVVPASGSTNIDATVAPDPVAQFFRVYRQ